MARSPSSWAVRPFHCCSETGPVVTTSFTVTKGAPGLSEGGEEASRASGPQHLAR